MQMYSQRMQMRKHFKQSSKLMSRDKYVLKIIGKGIEGQSVLVHMTQMTNKPMDTRVTEIEVQVK